MENQYETGEIYVSEGVGTKHCLNIIEYLKNTTGDEISSFYGPGGTIYGRTTYWTHNPRFHPGMEVLITLTREKLNDIYVLDGIFPYGRAPTVYVFEKVDGREALIPYPHYWRNLHSTGIFDPQVNAAVEIRLCDEMIDLSKKSMLWYDDLNAVYREVQKHE